MTKSIPMINTALHYLTLNLSVIPVKSDTKAPTIQSWKPYQTDRMTPDQAFQLFSTAEAIAVITGRVSDNLIIIDFDNHFGDAGKNIAKYEKMTRTDLLKQSTPSGGFHLIYRTPQPGKNRKLAQRLNTKGQPDTLIETRGEGGYALIYPSPKYAIIQGSFDAIPVLTESEHDELMTAAMSFNEFARVDHIFQPEIFGKSDLRPGDQYDQSSDGRDEVPALLTHAGWKSTDGMYWKRPGKDAGGISATWGKVTAGGIPLFYCFSTNGGIFEDQKSYKPFQIFSLLAHNGDFEGAARELRERGFGAPKETNKEVFKRAITAVRSGKVPNFSEWSADLGLSEADLKKQYEEIREKNKDEIGIEGKTDIEKAEIYLNKHYQFRKNIVSQKVEMKLLPAGKDPDPTQSDWVRLNENTVYCDFQRHYVKFKFDNLKSLLKSDFVPEYDPFVEYFNSLPAWDGVDYIRELCQYVKCDDSDWFAVMLTKHLVRAIKCAIEPEYYNRMVLTLVSEEQEIGKSYFIRFLNPFGLNYYSEEFLRDDKDSQFRLSENFMYNLEELDTLSKMDVGKLKAMISKSGVNERVPYESQKVSLPRRCTFFGSTNRTEFLIDDRNTRWMVFTVTDFDRAYSKKINIHDVWTQAWALYQDADFNPELEKDEAMWRDRANKDFQIQEAERTILLQNLDHAETQDQYMTNIDIMTMIVDVTQGKLKLSTTPQKIGRIMSELRFHSGQRSINGKNCRVYYAKRKDFGSVAINPKRVKDEDEDAEEKIIETEIPF